MTNHRIIEFITLEIKLIARNRKPRQNFYQMLIVYSVSMACISYLQNDISHITEHLDFILLLLLSMCGSNFIFLHGVYLLTWESTFFEGLSIQNIAMKDYFKAKYYLFVMSAIFYFAISFLPLILMDYRLIMPLFSITVFNAGVSSLMILIYAFFNSERAYLEKSIFLNNEGYGMWQYSFMMLMVSLPCFLINLLHMFLTYNMALILIAAIGFFAILTNNYWLKLITRIYIKRKYIMIQKYSEVV